MARKQKLKEIASKFFAVFVIYLFVGSLVSVDVVAEDPPHESNEDKEFKNRVSTGTPKENDYSNPRSYPDILKNPNFEGKYSDKVPPDYIKDIPKLTSEQLAFGSPPNLEKLGSLGELVKTPEGAVKVALAIKKAYNLPEKISLTIVSGVAGLSIKDGILKNDAGELNLNDYSGEKGSNVKLISIVKPGTSPGMEAGHPGIIICFEGKECNILTSNNNIKNIVPGADENGQYLKITDSADKTIILREGSGDVAVINGVSIFYAKDKSTINFRGAEITAHGQDNKETEYRLIGDGITIIGPAILEKQNIKSTIQRGVVLYSFDESNNIRSINSNSGDEETEVKLSFGNYIDKIQSGIKNFDKNQQIVDFTLGNGKAAFISGIGKISAPSDGKLYVSLQSGDGIVPILDARGAAISQILKLRHALTSEENGIIEQLKKGQVSVPVYEQDPVDGKIKEVRKEICNQIEDCRGIISKYYNSDRINSLLEAASKNGNQLYLVRNFETGNLVMGDASGTGKFELKNDFYGRLEGLDKSESFFFRSKAAAGYQSFYVDSYERDPGKIFDLEWNVPIENKKTGRDVLIYQGKAYEVDSQKKVYDSSGALVDEDLKNNVLESGKTPIRKIIYEKQEGQTHAKIKIDSVLETSLFNGADWNLKEGYNYKTGHNVKLFYNREPTEQEFDSNKAVTNYLEISTDAKRLTLAGAVGQFKDHNLKITMDASDLQLIINDLNTQRGIVAREVAASFEARKIEGIIDELKKQYSGSELANALRQSGIVLEGSTYTYHPELIKDGILGYISQNKEILANDNPIVVSAQLKEAVKNDPAFSALFSGIEQSELGNRKEAVESFKEALDNRISKAVGVKALADEYAKDKKFDEAYKVIDDNSQNSDVGTKITLGKIRLGIMEQEGKFVESRVEAEKLKELIKLNINLIGDSKSIDIKDIDGFISDSFAKEFLQSGKTDLDEAKEFMKDKGIFEDSALGQSIITAVLSNALKESMSAGENQKTKDLTAQLTTHIAKKNEVSSSTYSTLADANYNLRNYKDAEILYRKAEEALGDEAAKINYDSKKGFNFGIGCPKNW